MLSFLDFDWYFHLVEAIEKALGIKIPGQLVGIVFLILFAAVLILITRGWRNKQIDKLLKDDKKYTRLRYRWLYIKTRFQENPPDDYPEPNEPKDTDHKAIDSNPIKISIKHFFGNNIDHSPFYFVLGSSGMGKTTFVYNLIKKYYNHYFPLIKRPPYTIKLLFCGDYGKDPGETLFDNIKKIEKQDNTILILDALDENNDAINNYSSFLGELIENVANFRFVIITCRTQFFEKQAEELLKLKKRGDHISKKLKKFNKYYISPFQNKEINRYLIKKYLFRFSARKKAKKIVGNCKNLMARPLLLSHIDDLLNSKIEDRKESIVQIYEILIEKWLEREADYAGKEGDDKKDYINTLLEFSKELALCFAQPSYDKEQMNSIVKKYIDKTRINEKNLKGRSLLTQNTSEELKFAHKSIMEYLVAKQLIDQHKQTGWFSLDNVDCNSNDMIPLFLFYMISNGKPTKITLTDNKITFSGTSDFHHNYGLSPLEHIFCVESGCSDNIEKNLSSFFKTICNTKNNRWPINIIIDCTYNYDRLEKIINHISLYIFKGVDSYKTENNKIVTYKNGESFFIPNIIFENYNFRDEKMVDCLHSLNNPFIYCFVIDDYETILSANQKIVNQLIKLDNDSVHFLAVLYRPSLMNKVEYPTKYIGRLSHFSLFSEKKHWLVKLQDLLRELDEEKTSDNNFRIINLYNEIARVYAEIGNYKLTLEYVYNALQGIYIILIYYYMPDGSDYGRGVYLYKGEKYKEALASLKKAVKDIREIEDNSDINWVRKRIQDCIDLTESVLKKQKQNDGSSIYLKSLFAD